MKASRQTTLQTVIGSPVKGGVLPEMDLPEDGMQDVQFTSEVNGPLHSANTDITDSTSVWTDIETDRESDGHQSQDEHSVDNKGKGKASWKDTVSRRASLASQFLTEALSELPLTPEPAPQSSNSGSSSKSPKRHHGIGLRSSSRAPNGSRNSDPRTKNAVAGANAASGSSAPAKPGTLTVLKGCSIYVDVRTDDGDDAGSLFVDMLRGMGARVGGN